MSKKKIQQYDYIELSNGQMVPNTPGRDVKLIAGKAYRIEINKHAENGQPKYYIQRVSDPELPKDIFWTKDQVEWNNKVLKTWERMSHPNLGIMLHGLRGAGKTMTAEFLGVSAGCAIIRANPEIRYDVMAELLQHSSVPVCIIFDEFEKYFRPDGLITFLDSSEVRFKKMCIFTCNQAMTGKLDPNLFERPGRIRYLIPYNSQNYSFVENLIKEFHINDRNKNLYKFIIKTFTMLTIDVVRSFLEEVVIHGYKGPGDLIALAKDMNIGIKNDDAKFRDVTIKKDFNSLTVTDLAKYISEQTNKTDEQEEIRDKFIDSIDEMLRQSGHGNPVSVRYRDDFDFGGDSDDDYSIEADWAATCDRCGENIGDCDCTEEEDDF